jgi:hypothetical protein
MDETAYRQALTSSIPRHCPFERSVLTHCAECSRAEKHNIAEREAVSCNSEEARKGCIALHDSLRHNFKFALGKSHIDGPLPHAQEMRIQCGGLKGLQFILDGKDQVEDINVSLAMAQQKFGELADFPYAQIVRWATTHYKAR